MSARQQYVSMVARGGLGVTLVDAKGNPYATTGDGALVFNHSPRLIDPIFEGAASINRVIMELGSEQLPALQVGPLATGWYAPTEDRLAITLNGNTTVQFNPDGVAIIGNLSYSGQLTGAYHDPLTQDGDIYVRLGGISTRLPKGTPGEVLQSTSSGLQWGSVTGTGTVNLINTQAGELTGGPITVSGTLGLADTAVSPGNYGNSTSVAAFNVDQKGRITAAGSVLIDVPLILGYTPADVAQPLSQFAATTSAQLASIMTDETGSAGGGLLVFNRFPTIIDPTIRGIGTSAQVTLSNGTDTALVQIDSTGQMYVRPQKTGSFLFLGGSAANSIIVSNTGAFPVTTQVHQLGNASNTWAQVWATQINMNAALATTAKEITFRTNGSMRWNLNVAGAESTGNAGSNFLLNRSDDAGVFIDTPLSINRATGVADFIKSMNVGTYGQSSRLSVRGTDNVDAFNILNSSGTKFFTITPESAADTARIGYWTGAGFGTTVHGGHFSATGQLRLFNTTAPPAGGTLGTGLMMGNSGTFGVMYGTGVPDKAAPIGTIYLRGNAPGAPYYNADGTAAGWAQIGGGVSIGTTPPSSPQSGQQWWYSDDVAGGGQMFLYYVDPSGAPGQWVASSPSTSAAATTPGGDFSAFGTATITAAGLALIGSIFSGNANGAYNAANGRYTPAAGRYVLYMSAAATNSGAVSSVSSWFRKNGVQIGAVVTDNTPNAGLYGNASNTITVDANGTDYFEFFASCFGNSTDARYQFGAYPISGVQGPPGPMPVGNYWRQLKRVVPVAGQTNIDFVGADIPSDINDLMFTADVTPQTNDVMLLLRFFDNTGTIDATAGHYSWSLSRSGTAGGTVSVDNSAGAGGSGNILLSSVAATARVGNTTGIRAKGEIINIKEAGRVKTCTFQSNQTASDGSADYAIDGAGLRIAGAITGFRLVWHTGNFAAGGAVTLWGSP